MNAGTATASAGYVRVLRGGHYGGDLMYGSPETREMVDAAGTVMTFSRAQRREQAKAMRKRGNAPPLPPVQPPVSATAATLRASADQLTALAASDVRMSRRARRGLLRDASVLRAAAEGRERDAEQG